MISQQYGTFFADSEYDKIKKVASIWICKNPPGYRKNTIASYSLEKRDLVGEIGDIKSNYDLLAVVMVCLGGKDVERYSELIKMLDVLFSQETVAAEKKKVLQEEYRKAVMKKLGLVTC